MRFGLTTLGEGGREVVLASRPRRERQKSTLCIGGAMHKSVSPWLPGPVSRTSGLLRAVPSPWGWGSAGQVFRAYSCAVTRSVPLPHREADALWLVMVGLLGRRAGSGAGPLSPTCAGASPGGRRSSSSGQDGIGVNQSLSRGSPGPPPPGRFRILEEFDSSCTHFALISCQPRAR